MHLENVAPNDFENQLPLLTHTSEKSHTGLVVCGFFFKASLKGKG